MTLKDLSENGFKRIGSVQISKRRFLIKITDRKIADLEKCGYAFFVGNRVVRIGSCKAPLKTRLRDWELGVTKRLKGKESSTPAWEAKKWKAELTRHPRGSVYARLGTMVKTPVGKFRAYLDEESVLIGRYLPCLDRSKHR